MNESAEREFMNITLLLTVSTEHVAVVDKAPSMTIKLHVYDPPSVYYEGKVTLILELAGTASVS